MGLDLSKLRREKVQEKAPEVKEKTYKVKKKKEDDKL